MTEIIDKMSSECLAECTVPEGWRVLNAQSRSFMNFCYPEKMYIELETEGASLLYTTGEGFSFVGGADVRTPQTMFIDYRAFEYLYEYIEKYAAKLQELSGKEFSEGRKIDIEYDEEAGKKKVENHAVREIKRQGGNNGISIILLYYEEGCVVFKVGDKNIAIATHIEAVKAGMDAKGLKSKLAGKVAFGDDNDLKVLNPMQTMDWESNNTFIMICDEDKFESAFSDLIEIRTSFKESEYFENRTEARKKEIQGKLFMSGKSSKKMQAKKYTQWQKINANEKNEEAEYIKEWIEGRL